MKFASMISAVALGMVMTSPALAQESDAIGVAKTVEGEVLLARGADTITLQEGDELFENDRIVTRTDARVELVVNECEQVLDPVQSIVVDDEFCTKAPLQLASNNSTGQTPPVKSGPSVGVIAGGGLLVAAIAIAANDDDDNNSTPVSP